MEDVIKHDCNDNLLESKNDDDQNNNVQFMVAGWKMSSNMTAGWQKFCGGAKSLRRKV